MEIEADLVRVRSLSDAALLLGLSQSLRSSRHAVAEVVAHLGEVEERRLHLLGGHSSLFGYCLSQLGMSEDEAWRRIEAARLCRLFPRLLQLLAAGHISLSVASLLRARLTSENHQALLAAVSGKTVARAREVLATWFPRPDVRPLLRKLPTRAAPAASARASANSAADLARAVPGPSSSPASLLEPDVADGAAPAVAQPSQFIEPRAASTHVRTGSSAKSASRSIEPLSPDRYKLQLTVSSELKGKLELARDLLRHAVPSGDLPTLIERALDVLLEQTQKRRFGQRAAAPRSADAPKEPTRPAPDETTGEPSAAIGSATASAAIGSAIPSAATAPTRHIPNAVRREVHARDDGRCTWQGPDGTRCNSRAWLEHDHIIPRGLGGTHDPANIRGFCRAHNRLAAEQVYGKETLARIIAQKQARRSRARSGQASPPAT